MDNAAHNVYNHLFCLTVQEDDIDLRLDIFIAKKLPTYSRSFYQKLLTDKQVELNGKIVTKPSTLLKLNDAVQLSIRPVQLGIPKPFTHDLGVELLHEDRHFLIIFKPAGLMVHAPSLNSTEVTLVDWLLTIFKDLATVGSEDRPGIVHRLDKDTSGIMVIPRTNYAHAIFGTMFKNRAVHKVYWAVVEGHPPATGIIDLAIDRHPHLKHKMTHLDAQRIKDWQITGRQSTTHYQVLKQFADCSLVEVRPLTGRTHQIRVHLTAIGHPLLGDNVYGTKSPLIQRQALHAHSISFSFEGKAYSFSHEVPEDFKTLLQTLAPADGHQTNLP